MNMNFLQMPRSRVKKWLVGILLVLAVVIAAGTLLLFGINHFSLDIVLKGERAVILEYGQTYEEPGLEVTFRGTLFCKESRTPENVKITVDGSVDDKHIGRYKISYSASYLCFSAETERTVSIVDTVCPVITLTEDTVDSLNPETVYQEAGFRATDNVDGDITHRVIRGEEMGLITYAVTDSSGNPAYAQREVPHHDPIPPEILLEGGEHYVIQTGTKYQEPGYSAQDNVDGDLSEQVRVAGEVNWLKPGKYPITYVVSDEYGNETTVIRNVEVTAAPRPTLVWPEGRAIYLTFDDGPGPHTQKLLDILDSYGVKATFFVKGTEYPELMKEIVDRGHSIGIHSVTHIYEEIYVSPEAYFEDLYQMQQIIYENTGIKTTLMRFPGGSSNTVSTDLCKGIMTFLEEAVQDAGFQYFDWNVDSNDAGGARTVRKVSSNVIKGVKEELVSVVLQHDIHSYSFDAVEDIIRWGLENGYTFLPLKEDSPGFHHGAQN